MGIMKLNKGDEIFQFMRVSWNVTKALELIGNRNEPHDPDDKITVHGNPALVGMMGMIRIDDEYAKTVDLSRPIIFTRLWEMEGAPGILIDGWHRVHRAIQENVHTLPFYLLTKEEDAQCRIS